MAIRTPCQVRHCWPPPESVRRARVAALRLCTNLHDSSWSAARPGRGLRAARSSTPGPGHVPTQDRTLARKVLAKPPTAPGHRSGRGGYGATEQNVLSIQEIKAAAGVRVAGRAGGGRRGLAMRLCMRRGRCGPGKRRRRAARAAMAPRSEDPAGIAPITREMWEAPTSNMVRVNFPATTRPDHVSSLAGLQERPAAAPEINRPGNVLVLLEWLLGHWHPMRRLPVVLLGQAAYRRGRAGRRRPPHVQQSSGPVRTGYSGWSIGRAGGVVGPAGVRPRLLA